MRDSILIVAAHPDDEVLGCGGTAAAHALHGDEVHILILAEGVTSRDASSTARRSKSELAALRKSAQQAAEIIGASSLTIRNYPDNRMDSVDLLSVVKTVENFINRLKPRIVYTHHRGDLNVDHRITHQAVVTACRPLTDHPVNTMLFFETPSSTEWQSPGSGVDFAPAWFVDITKTLDTKLAALRTYRSEMRPWPHPRSARAIEHLAGWRGAAAGFEAAESFMIGRHRIGRPERNSDEGL
jgi:LmbE family N-acetylglucosaminyl deacetylase